MGTLGVVIAVLATWFVARRSLAHGFGVLLAVGYLTGIFRANYPSTISRFVFDAATLALYLAVWLRPASEEIRERTRAVKPWVMVLVGWAALTILLSPIFSDQPFLIQLVGFRAAVYFLPLLLICARFEREDLAKLSTWVLVLNLVAFGFALAEWRLGVSRFFPQNDLTWTIYHSHDVSGGHLRIPSCFGSAHLFGGTMAISLALLMLRLELRIGRRWLTALALLASVIGIFMSATREPVVVVGIAAALLLLSTRLSPRVLGGILVVGVAAAIAVGTSPRLQRFTQLSDLSGDASRLHGSLNATLLDVIDRYPMGAGLGSAAQTSIPGFLQPLARQIPTLENEYAAILLEQGVIGLFLWLLFIAWIALRIPPWREGEARVSARAAWALALATFGSAVIGTGLLVAVPMIALVLLLVGWSSRGKAPAARVEAQVEAAR